MTDSMELEVAIVRSRKTKRELAKALHISDMGFYKKIANRSEFKASEIKTLQELLSLSDAERDKIFFATKVECNSTKEKA